MKRIPVSLLICSLIPAFTGAGLIWCGSETRLHRPEPIENLQSSAIEDTIPKQNDQQSSPKALSGSVVEPHSLQSAPSTPVISANDKAMALFEVWQLGSPLPAAADIPLPARRPASFRRPKRVYKLIINDKILKFSHTTNLESQTAIASSGPGVQGKNSGAREFLFKEGLPFNLFALPHR